MKYGSVCSGIEAATVAWHPLEWEAAFYSEIEPFPCAVLNNHYPSVPNHGDMTKFKEWPSAAIDVLVGGTPCQSFSVAGFRKGLADPRGNLMLTFGAIASRYCPKWLVWENVPGVLSANGGKDFGTFLGMLGECGYGFAYRVLDAQFFGVAQRRRRVFVVGYFGDWRPAAAVLFERHSLSGDSAPSRETGQRVAPSVTAGAPFNRTGNSRIEAEAMVCMSSGQANAEITEDIAPALNCNRDGSPICFQQNTSDIVLMDQGGGVMNVMADGTVGTLRMETHGHEPIIVHATQDPVTSSSTAFALGANSRQAVAWSEELTASIDVAGTIQRGGDGGRHDGVMTPAMQVRRLTPIECERLQGFPDNYTKIPWRNKPPENCPDGPRYKALGNSMAVPVMAWIGDRIQQFN